jgi:serine/threonine protein kinase
LATSLTSALVFLEQMGILHNDLKSSNILWKRGTNDGEWKLADFGSAQTSPFLKIHKRIGTLSTAAPEMFMGSKHFSNKSDVWSFGCVMWESLFSNLPFDFSDLHAFQNGYTVASKFPARQLVRGLTKKSKSRWLIGNMVLNCMLEPVIPKRWGATECMRLSETIDKHKQNEHLESYIGVRACDL